MTALSTVPGALPRAEEIIRREWHCPAGAERAVLPSPCLVYHLPLFRVWQGVHRWCQPAGSWPGCRRQAALGSRSWRSLTLRARPSLWKGSWSWMLSLIRNFVCRQRSNPPGQRGESLPVKITVHSCCRAREPGEMCECGPRVWL